MKIELIYDEVQDRWCGQRMFFKEASDGSILMINTDEELIGRIERIRVGSWIHWCMFLEDGCYLSPRCNDEARAMQRKCYSLFHGGKS